MTVTATLIYLAGSLSLLIWAVRMVRTGVERAFGTFLNRAISAVSKGRFRAAILGILAAIALQSSTAVALLTASFAATEALALPTGLALLLGADLGSAIVARLLTFDISIAVPVLLILGGVAFLKGHARNIRQFGRILVGIALVLTALQMMSDATFPLRESKLISVSASYLSNDFLTAFLIGAVVAWLLHSSIGAVLLIVTLAAQGAIPVLAGISLVLGANFGGGLIALGLTRTATENPRRIVLCNAILRGVWATIVLVAANQLHYDSLLIWLGGPPADQIVNAHLLFNLSLLVIGMPLLGPTCRVATLLIPTQDDPAGSLATERVSALNPQSIASPHLAVASAKRELLYMSETLQTMLRPLQSILETCDKAALRDVRLMDDRLDTTHSAIKKFTAGISRQRYGDRIDTEYFELAGYAVRLEQAGDIIVRDLLRLAVKKGRLSLDFTADGWSELIDLHDRVLANIALSQSVLISGDRHSARQLIEEKESLREIEYAANLSHLNRLSDSTPRNIETSEIQLEIIHHLKRINSLISSIAYPILDETGELLDSRLTEHQP